MKRTEYLQIVALTLIIIGSFSYVSTLVNSRTQVAAISGADSGLISYTTFDAENTAGIIGNAKLFNGIDTNVQLSDAGLPAYRTGGYSISFWVKAPAGQTNRCVYCEGNTTNSNPFLLLVTGNAGPSKLQVNIRDDSGSPRTARESNKTVFDDSWHHVVWADSGGSGILYIDGVQDSAISYTVNAGITLNTSTIGALRRSSLSSYFSGTIDDVRVYSRTLTATEVGDLYALGGGTSGGGTGGTTPPPPPPPPSSGPQSYYIDFAGGNDANAGTSISSPWKHAPGDPNATGAAASAILKGGDQVIFKKGVTYDGAIILSKSGLKITQGSTGTINSSGVFTDTNFGSVLPGDFIYIYNTSTNGSTLDSDGMWKVAAVSANQLTLSGFDGKAYSTPALTYQIYRPIIFTSDPSWGSGDAVLSGGGVRDYIIDLEGQSYIRISDLAFTATRDVAATGCTSPDNRGAIWDGNGGTNLEGLIVENNKLYNIWSAIATGLTTKAVFKGNMIDNVEHLGIVGGEYSLTENNRITRGSSNIRGQQKFSIIRNNTMSNDNRPASTICGFHTDGIGPLFSPSSDPNSNQYGWIYGNTVSNTVEGIFLTNNNGGTSHWTIRNNILIGYYGAGGSGDTAIFVEGSPYTTINNNTIIGLNGSEGWIRGISLGDRGASGNSEIKYNIIYSLDPKPPAIGINDTSMPGTVIDGNAYYAPNYSTAPFVIKNFTTGANTFYDWAGWNNLGYDRNGGQWNINPLFVNPAGTPPDVHLQNGSPAAGHGAYGDGNITVQTSTLVGDFNGDGSVNTFDWGYMNVAWNTNNPTYDLNKDGKINTLDLAILIKNWTN